MLMFALGLQLQAAQPASRFVDSIGINTHLSYWDTPYGKRFPEVAELLERSGIRHVRDGVVLGQTRVCDEERELASHGIRFDYVTQANPSAADLLEWARCTGPAIESFEGLNEYDISHPRNDTDWAATVRRSQQALYREVKSSPHLRSLSVVGPSLTSAGAARRVGDLSDAMDYGNIHNYFGGHEPGTPGWGLGGYGSIAFNVAVGRTVAGGKPILATETGYGTSPSSGDVPENIQLAYVPRLFLDQFAAGIVRTDLYELVDEGGPPYANFGLLTSDLRPKPAFTALSDTIALLADDREPRTLARIPLSLAGDLAGVRDLILEKHDGRTYVAVWQVAAGIEPKTRLPLPIATRDVTLSVGDGRRIEHVYAYGDNGHLTAMPQSGPATSVSLAVRDRAEFVELDDSGSER
jgi:hypothetical protein